MVCLVTSSVSVVVNVTALFLIIWHTVGNAGEVAGVPVLLQSSLTSLGLMRTFLSSFSGKLTNMTGNEPSIGSQNSPVVGKRYNASEA